jgi:hypothetical protein
MALIEQLLYVGSQILCVPVILVYPFEQLADLVLAKFKPILGDIRLLAPY